MTNLQSKKFSHSIMDKSCRFVDDIDGVFVESQWIKVEKKNDDPVIQILYRKSPESCSRRADPDK